MSVATVLLDLFLGGCAGVGLGYVLGKRAKLNELHKLQDEGYINISVGQGADDPSSSEGVPAGGGTAAQPSQHTAQRMPTPYDLVNHPEFAKVTRQRRDGPERRTDWAAYVKHKAGQPDDEGHEAE